MNSLENSVHMGGYLTGIGKVKKNGEIIYNKLEKPIKNRITSSGIDHLLMHNGSISDTLPTGYVSDGFGSVHDSLLGNFYGAYDSNTTQHYGILTYCGIGSGSNNTSFNSTSLVNQIGSLTSSRKTGTSFQGTKINSYGNYTVRITHQHNAVSGNQTVNEIGWFGRYGSTPTYVMFSRVILPSPVELLDGESLITTYELTFDLLGKTPAIISNVFNLKDTNGNTLQAKRKLVIYQYNNGWSSKISAPYLTPDDRKTYISTNTNSNDQGGYYYRYNMVYPGYVLERSTSGNNGRSSARPFLVNGSTNGTFPADGSIRSEQSSHPSGELSWSTLDYKCQGKTSKYRDRTFKYGIYAPNMTNTPDGYFDFNRFTWCGYEYLFGYDDNGTWVDQYLRKYANQELTLRFRLRYMTEDTTNDVYDSDPADPV